MVVLALLAQLAAGRGMIEPGIEDRTG